MEDALYTIVTPTGRALVAVISNPPVEETDGKMFFSFSPPVQYNRYLTAMGVEKRPDESCRLRCCRLKHADTEITEVVMHRRAVRPEGDRFGEWKELCSLGTVYVKWQGLECVPLEVTGWAFDQHDRHRDMMLAVNTPLIVRLKGAPASRIVAIYVECPIAAAEQQPQKISFLLESGLQVPLAELPTRVLSC